jgi:hypothetical protein
MAPFDPDMVMRHVESTVKRRTKTPPTTKSCHEVWSG